MKKILILLSMISNLSVNAQTRTALTPGGNVTYKIHKGKYLLLVNENAATADTSKPAGGDLLGPHMELKSTKNASISFLNIYQAADMTAIKETFKKFKNAPEVAYVAGVLELPDGTMQAITNKIACKLKSGNTRATLDAQLKNYGIDSVVTDRYDSQSFLIYLSKDNIKDAFDIANELFLTKLFDYAEVSYLRVLKPNAADPLQGNQWGLSNAGSMTNSKKGADMSVLDAWNFNNLHLNGTGIRIAVIDEGVDLNHPDLKANLLPGLDAVSNRTAGGPVSNDAHGTACAGIIAAVQNDIGCVGIAYGSKVIPVRIAFSNWDGKWVVKDEDIANGINWAVKIAGADIISCSWGGGSESDRIKNILADVIRTGRNGKGTLVIFAAGNDNYGQLNYPSNLPGVIAVGASTICDNRKTKLSCDGEPNWGSNYGDGLSVVAPGVLITTTDISGEAGYSEEDYVNNFNGTSSACPAVAGVLALVLQANPALNAAQARYVLEKTADKIPGYVFTTTPTYPSGSWNKEVGYGRVNALRAVAEATAIHPVASLH